VNLADEAVTPVFLQAAQFLRPRGGDSSVVGVFVTAGSNPAAGELASPPPSVSATRSSAGGAISTATTSFVLPARFHAGDGISLVAGLFSHSGDAASTATPFLTAVG
jgi:hypothetical protein